MSVKMELFFALVLIGFANCYEIKEEIIQKVCMNDEACSAAAARCLDAVTPSAEELSKLKGYFSSCVTSGGLQESLDAFDAQHAETDLDAAAKYRGFVKFIEASNAAAATDFRCCFGQAAKALDASLNVNLESVKAKTRSKVTSDPEVLDAILSAVDSCPAELTGCDGAEYRKCLLTSCVGALTQA